MIQSFSDDATADVFHGINRKVARRILRELWPAAKRKIDMLDSVTRLDALRIPPGNHLEALKGDRAGVYSIRVNDQYRITFRFEGEQCYDVRCEDYH